MVQLDFMRKLCHLFLFVNEVTKNMKILAISFCSVFHFVSSLFLAPLQILSKYNLFWWKEKLPFRFLVLMNASCLIQLVDICYHISFCFFLFLSFHLIFLFQSSCKINKNHVVYFFYWRSCTLILILYSINVYTRSIPENHIHF